MTESSVDPHSHRLSYKCRETPECAKVLRLLESEDSVLTLNSNQNLKITSIHSRMTELSIEHKTSLT